MHTDPKTKEQFVDRILSYDFDGDFTALGVYRAQLTRLAANKFTIKFPATGQQYELVVKKPRGPRHVRSQRRPVTRTSVPDAPEKVASRRIERKVQSRPARRA